MQEPLELLVHQGRQAVQDREAVTPLAATAAEAETAQVLQATVAGQEEIYLSQVLAVQVTTTQVAAGHMALGLTTPLEAMVAAAATGKVAQQGVFTVVVAREVLAEVAAAAEAAAGPDPMADFLVATGVAEVAEVAAVREDRVVSSCHMVLR